MLLLAFKMTFVSKQVYAKILCQIQQVPCFSLFV